MNAFHLAAAAPVLCLYSSSSRRDQQVFHHSLIIVIDRVAGEIIRFVASVRPSVCLWSLSCLNRLTLIFGLRVDLNLG